MTIAVLQSDVRECLKNGETDPEGILACIKEFEGNDSWYSVMPTVKEIEAEIAAQQTATAAVCPAASPITRKSCGMFWREFRT